MDRQTIRQKINKKTDVLDQMYLTDIFCAFYPKAAEHTFFLSIHETFPRTQHILGYKTSLNEFKRTNYIKHFHQSQWYETKTSITRRKLKKQTHGG